MSRDDDVTIRGIIGKKIGTTLFYREDGAADCVTAIRVEPCTVTQIKTVDRDGYDRVQLGSGPIRRLNRPRAGHLKGAGSLFRHLREVKAGDVSDLEPGSEVNAGIFEPGEKVNVSGTSKGRGFAGGVKRHGFRGGPKTHGQSDRHRAPGSVGAGSTPGRVRKGLKMAGHMGNERITVRNLEVVLADPERSLMLVKGAVPGARNSLLVIQKAERGGR